MKTMIFLLLISLSASNILAADGDLDTSFGSGGTVNHTTPYSGHNSVVVQPDGKVLAAGQAISAGSFRFYVVRYNADGSLDTVFGTGGTVFAAITNVVLSIPMIVLQSDGKFILVGKHAPDSGAAKIILMRFNVDGSADTSYGTAGRTVTAFPGDNTPTAAKLQADGKLLITGTWDGSAYCIARFNTNGLIDTTFGTNGNTITLLSGTGLTTSLATQADGKIIMGGYFSTSFTVPFDFIVFRYNANGTLDTSFDNDGYAIADFNSSYDYANSVLVQPDGKIIAAGHGTVGGAGAFAMARYNANGSLDTTFGTNGKASTAFAGGTPQTAEYPAVLLANGKIVIGRFRNRESPNFGTETEIARFNSNGSIDTTFGTGGRINFATMPQIKDLAEQPDGKLIAVGANQPGFSIIARFLNTDTPAAVNNPAQRIADFDGDGKTDASVFRGDTWFINTTGGARSAPETFSAVQFGLATDKLAPADYDGDGKTDIAVWREGAAGSPAYFYILLSASNSVRTEQFGLPGDTLTPGDYDGDGKADPATYREAAQSNFYYRGSLNNPNGAVTYLPWGTAGDKAARGDFDGDKKLDAAVFRPANNTWYVRQSSDGQAIYRQFGLASDKRVSGDFDGDGKTDMTVVRDGVWYIWQSTNNQIRYQAWGVSSDAIAAGDYDGDSKTDFAIWRGGTYYVLNSGSGAANYLAFGSVGDRVVAAAYAQ